MLTFSRFWVSPYFVFHTMALCGNNLDCTYHYITLPFLLIKTEVHSKGCFPHLPWPPALTESILCCAMYGPSPSVKHPRLWMEHRVLLSGSSCLGWLMIKVRIRYAFATCVATNSICSSLSTLLECRTSPAYPMVWQLSFSMIANWKKKLLCSIWKLFFVNYDQLT